MTKFWEDGGLANALANAPLHEVLEPFEYMHLVKRPPVRRRKPAPPGGPWTTAEAAARLRCSIKTLKGYVETGALRYVAMGHGTKRRRRMFTDADINEFIASQTRRDVPCPSTRTRARRTGNSISGGEVIAFSAARRPGPGVKPKG